MILYRKAPQLRMRRHTAPEAPFWTATTIAPYSARRETPLALDYIGLRASGNDRVEVTVCEDVRDELERGRTFEGPVLIDATGRVEAIFRRGSEALDVCAERELAALLLISPEGGLPPSLPKETVVAVAAWPADPDALETIGHALQERKARWGIAVPILYPITTELDRLRRIADVAADTGAEFLAGINIESDATARHAIATALGLTGSEDAYAMLFHGRPDWIQLATERHVAALAAAHGLADFVEPPSSEERSNWNGAAFLARIATRMIAMELDLDLAGRLARSSRMIAELHKPIARIHEAATLGIVEGLDETAAEMLTQWLSTGSATFAEWVDEQWRLSRE